MRFRGVIFHHKYVRRTVESNLTIITSKVLITNTNESVHEESIHFLVWVSYLI